ncbi:M20 peptidase aminoacylase family protein [Erwiniaceae bacterium BAC15a-03b]|uniref:M20 peptidase aminoacylase family protein n=1 Tax=Winslowiella arboricola TaxID=2978220 RepID=A0A9J6PR42_9GAMM|nr:M20 peptidase aminoacylase family protein [Winslowiella arboricola]MCU5774518.1 M20 peptidase aminoacylase family protein [Winslowiella arboricola]MCU5778072.1 M20 peptidase aminoacylase family protein [Winslowiella arboricola]
MSNVLQHYHYLHEIPELGFQEFKTSAYLATALEQAGFKVTRNINQTTGIVAELDSGVPGPVLALRADMDALGHVIDGVACARHTCGHDAHSSVVLTAAEEIIRQGGVKKGRLKILFQPAEELGAGALAMVEGGALDDVDMLLGFHLRPLEECTLGQAVPAMIYSACSTLEATITGVPAHAARPHLGVNALDAAVMAVQAVNAIHLAPGLSWSAKATRFLCDAGVTNSVPDVARVCWDLRSQSNAPMDELKAKVTRAIEQSVAALGASAEVVVLKEMPAAEIHPEMTALISESIVEVLGAAGLTEPKTTPGSEDFFHYAVQRPQVKAGFWGLGTNLTPGLHHPEMRFDLSSLEIGVKIFKTAVSKVLG